VPLAFTGRPSGGAASDDGPSVAAGSPTSVPAAIRAIAEASLVPLGAASVGEPPEARPLALAPTTTSTLPTTTTTARPTSTTTPSDDPVNAAAVDDDGAAPESAPATTAPPTTITTAPTATTTTTAPKPTTTTAAPPTTTTTTAPSTEPAGGTQAGKASWYDLEGSEAGICAHRTLPFGTIVRVTNVANGKATTCEVGDRGPFIEGRVLDLFRDDFAKLAPTSEGVIDVRLEW